MRRTTTLALLCSLPALMLGAGVGASASPPQRPTAAPPAAAVSPAPAIIGADKPIKGKGLRVRKGAPGWRWAGARQVNEKMTYRLDPYLAGESRRWRSASPVVKPSIVDARAAWLLSGRSMPATPVAGAALEFALHAVVSPRKHGLDSRLTKRRLKGLGSRGSAVQAAARQLVSDAAKYAGPYVVTGVAPEPAPAGSEVAVQVKVVSASGQGMPGLPVSFVQPDQSAVSSTTDSAGTATLRVPAANGEGWAQVGWLPDTRVTTLKAAMRGKRATRVSRLAVVGTTTTSNTSITMRALPAAGASAAPTQQPATPGAGTSTAKPTAGTTSTSTPSSTSSSTATPTPAAQPDAAPVSVAMSPATPAVGSTATPTLTVKNPAGAELGSVTANLYGPFASAAEAKCGSMPAVYSHTVTLTGAPQTLPGYATKAAGFYVWSTVRPASATTKGSNVCGSAWQVAKLKPQVTLALPPNTTVFSAATFTPSYTGSYGAAPKTVRLRVIGPGASGLCDGATFRASDQSLSADGTVPWRVGFPTGGVFRVLVSVDGDRDNEPASVCSGPYSVAKLSTSVTQITTRQEIVGMGIRLFYTVNTSTPSLPSGAPEPSILITVHGWWPDQGQASCSTSAFYEQTVGAGQGNTSRELFVDLPAQGWYVVSARVNETEATLPSFGCGTPTVA